jgi:hypothetical protein
MDDIDQPTLNEKAGEATSTEVPSAEEPKTSGEVETPSEPVESTEETKSEETETETEDSSKKGATKRIRELVSDKKQAEEKVKSLEDIVAKLKGSVEPALQVQTQAQQSQNLVYEPIVKPGEEVDINELDRRVQDREQRLKQEIRTETDLKNKQSEAINRHINELAEARKLYPQLDSDSDSFDKDLSESVTEAAEAFIWQNPYTASAKTFISKMMKPYERAVTKEVGKVTENIAKQVSQTATRPTSVSTKGGKNDSELTIKELEDKYGVVNP